MTGLLTFDNWSDYAINIFCSNETCNNTILIDSRKIKGLIYCSKKCIILRK